MKDGYKLTVGLEIHAELNTQTKMFCDSKNPAGKSSTSNGAGDPEPNTDICPICMGHPGTLPTINKAAVLSVLRLGEAVGGKLADYTEFDRKNYFYPDIPKGYQISQYKHPLVSGGELNGVKITRIHLEEDTARTSHDKGDYSLVDFNRAGVPLMELVTEPVITTPEMARDFAKELQLLLTTLGIAEANMEKGEMRVEANISVSKDETFGTKVEVKNLNSFRAVEKAIEFEAERHIKLLEEGGKVVQETRGWDENRGETFSQRVKEDSHDYRYFPDPDLPKLFVSEIPEFQNLKETLPELSWEKRMRLQTLGISKEQSEIYLTQPEWGSYFEEVANLIKEKDVLVLASNFITSELKRPIDVGQFVEAIRMFAQSELSSRGTKEVLKIMQEKGGEARKIAVENNLMQISDRSELQKLVDEVLKEEKSGMPTQYLVGQAIKKSKGRANPVILQELFK